MGQGWCDRNSDWKREVVAEAESRVQQRKRWGKLRRLYSQIQKL